ncbi:MAG: DUF1365 domain-containing protein [Alphaproteobacteria bacterium]|nr:DUF1365 domain-containing protein [Alphaproteobacteria bacterium]
MAQMADNTPIFPEPGLFVGQVMHARLKPKQHKFTYSVFSILLDIDRLAETAAGVPLLRYNKPGMFSFHDRDHGARDGSPLRPWVDRHLAAAGLSEAGHQVTLLCFPRVLGYVFNPISVYFCRRADGTLGAVLYEVKNTFGDQHGYLVPIGRDEPLPHRHACDKGFYVSPFIEMAMRYNFKLTPAEDSYSLVIREEDKDGPLLVASQTMARKPLTARNLLLTFFTCPLLTLKVMGGIHWEALFIWMKGSGFNRRPAPPADDVTYITPAMTPSPGRQPSFSQADSA